MNERFNAQIERWESGELEGNDVVDAGRPMGVMRQFMPDEILTLRQKVLTKAKKKHALCAADFKGLPGALARPIFVFKSTPETVSVLTELKSATGKNLFVAVEVGVNKQFGHRTLEVNDILTIHGRETENVILPIVESKSLIWADKKKGLEWLSSAKSNSQAIAAQTLDDVAKVVNSFENPAIEGEKTDGFVNEPAAEYGAGEADNRSNWSNRNNRENPEDPAGSAEAENNLLHGIESLRKIAAGADEIKDAMHRNDLKDYGASTGITFVFGKSGDSTKNYKGGYGLAHIGAKHGGDTILKVLDAIASGKITRYVEGNKTVVIEKDGYEALLALTRYGNKETWLFNGWEKIETTGDNGKVSANTVSTQANPTFSRENLGVVVSNAKVGDFMESSKGNHEKEKVRQIIDSLRMNPGEAERIGLNLDDAAKVVNSFENPAIKGEKSENSRELSRNNRENPEGGDTDIESVNERFNNELEQQIDGQLPEGHIYQLGRPGEVLRSTGDPNLPIQMSASRLLAKAT